MSDLHLKSLSASKAPHIQPFLSSHGAKIQTCLLSLARDLDFWAESCPNLQSLILADPRLGIRYPIRSQSYD
jgi:hypothetical protein